MKILKTFLLSIAVLLLGVTTPALAHGTFNKGGTSSGITCGLAKGQANIDIGLAASFETITSRHVGKCEKDGDEYLVDWSVTGYDHFRHYDADHTHSGRSSSDAHGTDSYSN